MLHIRVIRQGMSCEPFFYIYIYIYIYIYGIYLFISIIDREDGEVIGN